LLTITLFCYFGSVGLVEAGNAECFVYCTSPRASYSDNWCEGHCKALEEAARAYNNGVRAHMEGQLRSALDWYQLCVRASPNYPDVYNNIAAIYRAAQRPTQAADMLHVALRLQPTDRLVAVQLGFLEQSLARWKSRKKTREVLRAVMRDALGAAPLSKEVEPFPTTAIDLAYVVAGDPRLALEAARIESRQAQSAVATLAPVLYRHSSELYIGFLLSDLRTHAVGFAMSGVIRHLSVRVALFPTQRAPNDAVWQDISSASAVHHISDLSEMPDIQAAQTVLNQRVHILINLNGNTEGARSEICAALPSLPLQLNFLGSPASLALNAVPYIVGDAVSLPPDIATVHYAEKALLLPFSHHPSDKHHFEELLPNQERLTKEDTPRGIFEMTAVNRILKLDAVTLSVWTQAVLRMVEVSPLLSLLAPAEARDNLLQHIQARGVQRRQMRLLERLAPQAHLQRHRAYLENTCSMCWEHVSG